MGKVIPIGSSEALAQAVLDIMAAKDKFVKDPTKIAVQYTPSAVAQAYVDLFNDISGEIR
jgi:hypothetical protein